MTVDSRGEAYRSRVGKHSRSLHSTTFLAAVLLLLCMTMMSGCSSINRSISAMESIAAATNSMAANFPLMADSMSRNMPLLAHSTARMAYNTDRAFPQIGRITRDLDKRGASAERAVQNYAQAFVDNDRALIQNLKGIKRELEMLRKAAPSTGLGSRAAGGNRDDLARRLDRLETRLRELTSRLDRIDSGSRGTGGSSRSPFSR